MNSSTNVAISFSNPHFLIPIPTQQLVLALVRGREGVGLLLHRRVEVAEVVPLVLLQEVIGLRVQDELLLLAAGLDKGPHLIFDGSGKRTFLMPEKFGGGQLLGNSPAVDGYKRFVGSLAQLVYALGHILFAGTACPVYQHRHVGGGHQFHVGVELAGSFALSFEERGLFGTSAPGQFRHRLCRIDCRGRSPESLVDFL